MQRKNLIILISIIIAIVIVLFFIFKKSPKIINLPSPGKSIVAFGDSLIEGVGATTGNDLSSQLSRKIGIPIINLGVSGNTTAQGLARIDAVNAQNPKVVLVLLGGNDFLQRVPIADTFKNLDAIVAELQKNGAVVILLGIQGGLLGDPYAPYFKDLSQRRGTLYVSNVLKGIITQKELMSDGIHPNDAGYAKIAEKIYPILQKAL